MKQLLLHGPAKLASRKKLIEIKQKFDQNNVVVFEEGTDLQTVLGTLATPSLFPEEQLIILENPAEDSANYTLYPIPYVPEGKESSAYTLALWFDHEIDSKKWPDFEILFFPEGKEISVFPFLDLLAAKDKRAFLEIEKLKKGGYDIYYFLTMVFYLLRSLAVTPKTAPSFVKDKLARQRKNFPLEKVKELYKEMLEIDFKIKSGLLEIPQAEFLMINKFTV